MVVSGSLKHKQDENLLYYVAHNFFLRSRRQNIYKKEIVRKLVTGKLKLLVETRPA